MMVGHYNVVNFSNETIVARFAKRWVPPFVAFAGRACGLAKEIFTFDASQRNIFY